MSGWRTPAARAVALLAVGAAALLGLRVLTVLDARPRTHDAYLYADSAALAPDVNGRITRIAVRDHERVRAGATLVEIDAEPYELRLAQARAQRDALRAQIDTTARQVTAQGSGADAARSAVERARVQLGLARDTLARVEPLLGAGYVTRQQVDEARANERGAEAALAGALLQATQARQAVTDTGGLVAQLRAADAAVALAERDLRNTVLRAPFDGTVAGLELSEGSYAAAGHALFSLVRADRWYAVADFRETELGALAIGAPATVWRLGDDGRAPLRGRVESIGPGVRPENGGAPGLPAVGRTLGWVVVAQRFPVRILLDAAPPEALRVGATVSVRVEPEAGAAPGETAGAGAARDR